MIERLKQRTEALQEELRIDRERRKPKPNENMDKDIPDRLRAYGFWCDVCQEDFTASAYKTRYRIDGHIIATLRGRCPDCETAAIRYATHRDQDPYYQRSIIIRKQRNQNRIEMLQANEYGFRTHYGDPDLEFNKIMAREEERLIRAELSVGLHGQSLRTKNKLEELRKVKEWKT